MTTETNAEKLIKEWESLPELKCNHCGAVFKGGHECSYEKLKEENARLREALDLIRKDTYWEDEEFVSVRHVIRKRAEKALSGDSNDQNRA